jgi:hypothetical protein
MVAFFDPAEWIQLSPEGWFHDAYFTGDYIWSPSPALAGMALEEMCDARHVRPWNNSHVFICPSLMTARWRKKLNKVADAIITIPVGSHLWPEEMFEPLTIPFVFPVVRDSPWILKHSPVVQEFLVGVQGMCGADPDWLGGRVRKLWSSTRALPRMPQCVARILLQKIPR